MVSSMQTDQIQSLDGFDLESIHGRVLDPMLECGYNVIIFIFQVGYQLSTPLIFILSHINGRSLSELCNSLG